MSETAVSTPDVGVSMREALGDLYDQMEGEGAPEGDVIASADEPELEAVDVEEIELDIPPEPKLSAPAHWAKERRELFEQATPDIQKAWIDREQEYERGIQAKAQEAAQYRQAIEPVRQLIQLRGMDETAWIRQMAGYTMALEQDPAGVIRAVAQQYGVDIGNLNPVQQADEFVDPQVKELREQLSALQRRIEESQQQAQRSTVESQQRIIEQFRDEKDATGNQIRPHFDAVYEDMLVLANGFRAAGKQVPELSDLYDRAVRMRPDLSQGQPQKAQANDLERAQRARRARSAAARPSGGVATGEQTKPSTLKDDLRSIWDQMEKRS
jgi:hypothetical protein